MKIDDGLEVLTVAEAAGFFLDAVSAEVGRVN